MDNVSWSQDRFNEVRNKLNTFLRQAGFKDNDLRYVPCSGLTGENLVEKSTQPEAAWYDGSTLIDIIGKSFLVLFFLNYMKANSLIFH